MRRINLLSSILLILGSAIIGNAQIHPPAFPSTTAPNNFYLDQVGVRLLVTQPGAVSGYKAFTISNDNSGSANEWGAAITTPIIEKDLVKSTPDSLACTSPALGSMTGKIAFIYRGDCEFGQKALAAQNAGAIACIIVNNRPGGPVGMGAGAVGGSVNIPVLMISKEDGDLINQQINAGQTVKASITLWGSNKTHDLAIFYNSIAPWHNYAIPLSQIGANNGNPQPYKAYDGAFIANLGSGNETSVELKAVTTFTPEGSTTAQQIRRDSISFPFFLSIDSILAVGMNSAYDVHATQKGRFDVTYSVKASSIDEVPSNNTATYSYHVTDNIFCKSRYDFTNNHPIATMYYRFGGTPAPTMFAGNLYYAAKGGYGITDVQISLSKENDTTLDQVTAEVFLFKWKDSLITDSLMEVGEMEIIGAGGRQFTANDLGQEFYTISLNKADAAGNPIPGDLVLEDSTWYYIAVVVPPNCFLGMDGMTNYYPRTFLRHHSTNNQFTEFYASGYPGSKDDLLGEQPNVVNIMYTFERGMLDANSAVDSARMAQQKNGLIPSIALRVTQWPLSVNNTPKKQLNANVYPNPATDNIYVEVDFDQQMPFVNYSMFDATGRKLLHIQHSNVTKEKVTLPTKGLPSGTYFVMINANNDVSVKKVIIN